MTTNVRGSTLAWNCKTPAEVDAAFALALAAGVKPLRSRVGLTTAAIAVISPIPTAMPGKSFMPPGFEFSADGRLILPD